MGFLSGIINTVVDAASTPIDAVKDLTTGNKNENTKKRVEKIGEDIEDIFDGYLF